jgi:carbon-monoxide dehydrogenase large subunit
MKRVGEAGIIASPVAIVNAVEDALPPFGVKFTQTPVTPEVIFSALKQA